MRIFRSISTLLALTAIGLLLFDLVYWWIVSAKIKIRSVEELLTDINKSSYAQIKAAAESFIPFDKWDFFVKLPAPAVILALAALFYLIFRILFLLSGESRGGRL